LQIKKKEDGGSEKDPREREGLMRKRKEYGTKHPTGEKESITGHRGERTE